MPQLQSGKFNYCNKAVVEFTAATSAVLENEGKVRLGIKRHGNLCAPVTVR